MQDASKSSDSLSELSKSLQRRLRSIKRFRREIVAVRAERLESVITRLIAQSHIVSTCADEAPKTIPVKARHAPIVECRSIEHREEAFVESQVHCRTSDYTGNSTNDLLESPQSTEEYHRVVDLLKHARAEYDELVDFMSTQSPSIDVPDEHNATIDKPLPASTIPRPLSQDITILHNQIEFLEQEINSAIKKVSNRESELDSLRNQIEILRTQLLEARHETIELRMQNTDLSDRLAQNIPPSIQLPANLTWEERKRQLMQQLEWESSADTEQKAASGNIQAIIETTQREISLRDQQILELKQLLSNQATATNGIAVGAAAVAEILDKDELVQQERENLRILQQEWLDKMRQAEIEISMERARIARDRLELQTAIEQASARAHLAEEQNAYSNYDSSNANSDSNSSDPNCKSKQITGRTRRWLQRLGLREE